jgi:hypothetical protein
MSCAGMSIRLPLAMVLPIDERSELQAVAAVAARGSAHAALGGLRVSRCFFALAPAEKPWRQLCDNGGGFLAPRTGPRTVANRAIAGFAFGADPRRITNWRAADPGWQVRRSGRDTRIVLYRPLSVPDRDRNDNASQRDGGLRRPTMFRFFAA